MNSLKTVGIIGGLGPETTSRFYSEIMYLCQQRYQFYRPPLMVCSVPFTYQEELKEIMEGEYAEEILELLIETAQKLEKSNAAFLVMPCNTSHVFINIIKNSINVPILNIIDETVKYLKNENITKIGVMSTLLTHNSKLYYKALAAHNIDFQMLDNKEQNALNKIILNLTLGHANENDKNALADIIYHFKERDVRNILLGCTALAVLMPTLRDMKVYDSMKILVEATVRNILNFF